MLNRQIAASIDLALAILGDPELGGQGLTLGELLQVEIPAGLPVGPNVVTAHIEPPKQARTADTRTMPLRLEGRAP